MADTRPTDFIGSDSSGRVRIDRVIPLSWVIGVLAATLAAGFAQYYGLQQTAAAVGELRVEVKALRTEFYNLGRLDVEHGLRLLEHERRLQQIENRRGAQ